MRDEAVRKLKKKYSILPGDKVLITVSRIAQEKSMDLLINYFVKCFSKDAEYKMFMVGDGPALASLREQARLLGVRDKIHFPGAVPNTEVPDYCHMADLFVSASLSEMYSISMLEALAAGIPAVIRLDEVNKGQITPGVNGFIFKDDSEFEQEIRAYFALPAAEREALIAGTIASVASYGEQRAGTGSVQSIPARQGKSMRSAIQARCGARISHLILRQKEH